MDNKKIDYGLTKNIEQPDPFHIQILFFLKLMQNFKQFSFKKAFLLLFVGPEQQTSDMPRLYHIPIQYHKVRIILGFIIFLIGYCTLSLKLTPAWLSFTIGMIGVLTCSGMVFLVTSKSKLKKLVKSN